MFVNSIALRAGETLVLWGSTLVRFSFTFIVSVSVVGILRQSS